MSADRPNTPKRLGTGMVAAACILLLALLTWLFQGQLNHQANPNRDLIGSISQDGTREVRLERNHSGHYVANGQINGSNVEFMLDTGATVVAIPGSIARRLQLKAGAPMLSRTANGTVQTYATVIDEVRLGNITQYDVRASILPQMEGSQILLGMSFLKRLELIQRGDAMTIRQP